MMMPIVTKMINGNNNDDDNYEFYYGNWKLLNLTPCCKFIQEKSIPWSMEVKAVQQGWQGWGACNLAPVVRRVDNTIH